MCPSDPAPVVQDKTADTERSPATEAGAAVQPTAAGAGDSMPPEDAA